MPDRERPTVLLRGPAEGDRITLPMAGLQAKIIRKAARTETGGHWALGEAWQDPGFDNPPHTHDEAEAFHVLEGEYTFYTDAEPAAGIGPGTLCLHPAGRGSWVPHGPRRRPTALYLAIHGRNRRVLRWSTTERDQRISPPLGRSRRCADSRPQGAPR
jgi:mannose-6-phosphate isomerase-like protein (cupin superfamily)